MVASQLADSVQVNTIADLTKAGKGELFDMWIAEPSRLPRVLIATTARPVQAASLHCKYEVAMIRLAFAVAIVIASLPVAMAQGTPREHQACTRDAQRFCRQDLGNEGAVQNCLQTHRTRLSKACSRVFESHGM
jgi:hypothetical protein